MQKYINQLIADLEEVAKNPPPAPYIEPPPHLEDDPVTSELALSPFVTIEELTSIKQEVFPDVIQLQGDQWGQVNKAILQLFDSVSIDFVDIPQGMPPEALYEVLTTNWHHPVQYLPSSGMDLELCTGDPVSCPYGEFCSCGDDFEEDEEEEIPQRFHRVVPEIASGIDAGLICFLNPDSLEIEEIPRMMIEDPG